MAIIKKRNIKTFKPKDKKEDIEELVDVDGAPIEGDRTPTNDSEIESSPQQTTDDFANSAIQPNRYPLGTAVRSIGEDAEAKMKSLIENLMENNGDAIPSIDELSTKYQKPIVANKAQELVDTFAKNNLNGEEMVIVLNHILSNINVDMIPPNFRNLLKSKI